MTLSPKAGFTLVELSIVLVIVGLTVGGILIGKDLIKAAQIRATIGQVEKISTAINTFRLKYNHIPGDIPSSQAAALGLFAVTGVNAGTSGYGDGNGLIEDVPPHIGAANSEPLLIWRHLSDAGLIGGNYGTSLVAANGAPPAGFYSGDQLKTFFPSAPLAPNYFTINAGNINFFAGRNSMAITGISFMGGGDPTPMLSSVGLTTWDAYAIDSKKDDGMPMGGSVRAWQITNSLYGLPATLLQGCIDASNNYVFTTTALTCQLRMELQ